MKPKQLAFHTEFKAFQDFAPRVEHGSDIRKGKRKLSRPFHPKKPLHLTLRSNRAKGAWSFLVGNNPRRVRHLLETTSQKYHVKLHRFANSGNHLHLLVSTREQKNLQKFLRVLSGLLVRVITGAKKGNPVGRFWDSLVYSRIIEGFQDFQNVLSYLQMNEMEGARVWNRAWDGPIRNGSGSGKARRFFRKP